MRVECNECVNFIKPIQEDENNILSKIKINAKCKLGKRVLFQKPKTMAYFDNGVYYRNCKEFKKL